MVRFSEETQKTEIKFKGDSLIPEPVDQIGSECVLRAIIYGGQMELRRVCFSKGRKCDLVFDDQYFRYLYERETRVPLIYDRSPRICRGLKLFRDMGIQVRSATVKFTEVPVVHLVDFRSYPPTKHPATGVLLNGLEFHEVMEIIRQNKPVLGSFAVNERFRTLGPKEIYDFKPDNPSTCATHCVLFMDGGFDEETDRNYLKFLNSHGPGFGEDGFGRVYFDLIYQSDSEYCLHTLSFEDQDSPVSQQPSPSRHVSSPSTANSVAETQDKQEQFGVTPAGLMEPLRESDYKRTHDLQEFLASTCLSKDLEDSAACEKALLKLDEIVKECVECISEKGKTIKMPKTLVLSSGSYSLRVHIPSDELEIVCVGDVNREELFETLHDVLRKMAAITDLDPVEKEKAIYKQGSAAQEAVDMQHSAARVIKFKLYGKSIVLLYGTLSEVPTECSAIFQDSVLSCIDEANLPVLDRCRASELILKSVPNIEHFVTALRYVNFWARRRSVYSNMTGFLGGVQWAIMVARVCQIYPSGLPGVLVMKVFEEYSRWFWPSPVMLCLIDDKPPFAVWNAPEKKLDQFHLMPIITPAYPCRNSSACVSEFTLLMLKQEFMLGFSICEKIKKGEACWSDLSEPRDFFKLYARYLQLDISVKDANDLRLWKLKVEPLWRELPMKIEGYEHKTRGHLHPYEYYDDTKKHCFLFIGLERLFKEEVAGVVISSTPMPVPAEMRPSASCGCQSQDSACNVCRYFKTRTAQTCRRDGDKLVAYPSQVHHANVCLAFHVQRLSYF